MDCFRFLVSASDPDAVFRVIDVYWTDLCRSGRAGSRFDTGRSRFIFILKGWWFSISFSFPLRRKDRMPEPQSMQHFKHECSTLNNNSVVASFSYIVFFHVVYIWFVRFQIPPPSKESALVPFSRFTVLYTSSTLGRTSFRYKLLWYCLWFNFVKELKIFRLYLGLSCEKLWM